MKQDDLLRQALSELAQEETEQFAAGMSREDRRAAETLFRRHKRQALSLIARHTGKKRGYGTAVLRIAAMLILVAGGVYLATRQAPPDITPLAPGQSASVAPFRTDFPSPTESPVPTDTASPIPTLTAKPDLIETQSPTSAPIPTDVPTPNPTDTPEPTATPAPTPAITPEPTASPAPQPPKVKSAAVPDSWGGAYFPGALPEGYTLAQCGTVDGGWQAVYQNGDDTVTFTEHASMTSIPVDEGLTVTYVQWDGVVALMADADGVQTLAWDLDGRSFRLTATDGSAAEIAKSVRKIQ